MDIEGIAMTERLTGVLMPLLTPYENDYSIAESLYLEHAAYCLDGDAHFYHFLWNHRRGGLEQHK